MYIPANIPQYDKKEQVYSLNARLIQRNVTQT